MRKVQRSTLLWVVLTCCAVPASLATASGYAYEKRLVASDLIYPWGVTDLGESTVLVSTKGGKLLIVDRESGSKRFVYGMPKSYGLMGVTGRRCSASHAHIFFAFVDKIGNRFVFSVSQAIVDLDEATLPEVQTIFELEETFLSAPFSGGGVLLVDDRILYFTTANHQEPYPSDFNPENGSGSVFSIELEPLCSTKLVPLRNTPKLISYGHRNSQALAVSVDSRSLVSVEHGPIGGDELNLLGGLLDHGWPYETAGEFHSPEGALDRPTASTAEVAKPAFVWDRTIAPTGIIPFGENTRTEHGNCFVLSTLKSGLVGVCQAGPQFVEMEVLESFTGRLRNISVGLDGSILVLTDGYEGKLFELTGLGLR
ncbi:MAG: PQQ-dependent sugar dehydrogenase [Pseudomonadota bacterium]